MKAFPSPIAGEGQDGGSMLLEIKNLSAEYFRGKKIIPALKNVSLEIGVGGSTGLVGESGSGKSTLALSILKLISPHEGRITGGEIIFQGRDLLALAGEDLRKVRGKEIGIIFQDPFSSLNPVLRIGEQIEEAVQIHAEGEIPKPELKARALEVMKSARLNDPERIYGSYPHQVSGGQRQRAMISIAIANRPKLLIADEPTTALDVTVQKEILDLLAQLKAELGMALLLITHHLGIVSRTTERLCVLFEGQVVEQGTTRGILKDPQHPYTRRLLNAIPEVARAAHA